MRAQASLLLANGHTGARHYPLGTLFTEAEIVAQRINQHEATRATLMQAAIGSVLSKKGARAFKETLEALSGKARR